MPYSNSDEPEMLNWEKTKHERKKTDRSFGPLAGVQCWVCRSCSSADQNRVSPAFILPLDTNLEFVYRVVIFPSDVCSIGLSALINISILPVRRVCHFSISIAVSTLSLVLKHLFSPVHCWRLILCLQLWPLDANCNIWQCFGFVPIRFVSKMPNMLWVVFRTQSLMVAANSYSGSGFQQWISSWTSSLLGFQSCTKFHSSQVRQVSSSLLPDEVETNSSVAGNFDMYRFGPGTLPHRTMWFSILQTLTYIVLPVSHYFYMPLHIQLADPASQKPSTLRCSTCKLEIKEMSSHRQISNTNPGIQDLRSNHGPRMVPTCLLHAELLKSA